LAPSLNIAGIRGAGVAIIAIEDKTGDTDVAVAGIVSSACVPIFAARVICHVLATYFGIAEIIGTDVFIVTIHFVAAHARSVFAAVGLGANIIIVTVRVLCVVQTSGGRVTAIQSAFISIIA